MFLLSFVLLLPNALLLFVSLSNTPLAFSTAINCSIDDTRGDSVTGEVPTYLPTTSGVWEDTSCPDCFLNPPTSNAFMGTYKAATYRPYKFNNMSITFKFTGTAVYIFFILANTPGPKNASAETAANFTLDGTLAGTFTHFPLTSEPAPASFQSNALAFSTTGLENGTHEFAIITSGPTQVWVNFDYALYTFEEAVDSITSSSSSSLTSATSNAATSAGSSKSNATGVIIGPIIGGLVVLGAAIVGLFYCHRHRHQVLNRGYYSTVGCTQHDIDPFILHQSASNPSSVTTQRSALVSVSSNTPDSHSPLGSSGPLLINEESQALKTEAREHASVQVLSDEPPPRYSPRPGSDSLTTV